MRTTIKIDDELRAEAMRYAKINTKRATVEEGLRLLVRLYRQTGIRKLRGKVEWEGNLDELRSGRQKLS